MIYHEKNKGLERGKANHNLNYWECMEIEQLGIATISTGWFNKDTNPNGNIINGISPLNKKKFNYYGAAARYVSNNLENEWTNLFH